MKNLKNNVGIVTITDPSDKRTWSGLNYKILSAIQNNFENVTTLGPLKGYGINKILAVLNKLSILIFKKKYNYTHSRLLSLVYSGQLNKRLRKGSNNYDTLIFIGSSSVLSFLKFKGNVIYLTDATINSLVDYYYFNLWGFSIKESNFIEQRAIKNSQTIFFASKWAQEETKNFYNVEGVHSEILKFGPNLDERHLPSKSIIRNVGRDIKFNLLFVGVDWERKGGDILLENYLTLFEKGYKNLSLTICGCVPPRHVDLIEKNITIHPFLNKNKAEDLELLQNIFLNSHLFILPTRAECSAVVYSEAAAYSLPILTFNTGGTSSYVEDSVNGYAIDLDLKYEFGSKILELMLNPEQYNRFSQASFEKYKKEMNWTNYSDTIRLLIEKK